MLVDYHMHLERGEHSFSYLDKMLAGGRARGVEEFGITEHSHHFMEFAPCYQGVIRDQTEVGRYQDQWLRGSRKFVYRLEQWVEFMTLAKQKGYPVKLGIEVCYFPGEEQQIAQLLEPYPWDFVTGSVHWLGGWGYDHLPLRSEWSKRGIDRIVRDYLSTLELSINSGLFDVIGHPFCIFMFGDHPTFDMAAHYERLAAAMARTACCSEINTGMLYRYPAKQATPPMEFLRLLHQAQVPIVLGSDAHEPGDVGRELDNAILLAKDCGYTDGVRFEQRRRISHPL